MPSSVRGGFDWPLRPRPEVVRPFDKPPQPWAAGHRGVDLAGVAGQSVVAAGAGVVVFAGRVADREVVSIDHEGGLRTTYEPVTPSVAVGDRVVESEQIGVLGTGHPGCPRAGCLHWGLRRENGGSRPEYLDPLGLLRSRPLRLEPVCQDSTPDC